MLARCYSDGQFKKNELGEAYNSCGREEKYIQNFGGENLKETAWT
jgi:hypothetical protein